MDDHAINVRMPQCATANLFWPNYIFCMILCNMYSNIPVNQDKWHYFHGNCNKSSDEFLLILFWQWFRCILCKEKMHKKNLQIPEWVCSSVLWFVTRLLLVLLVLRWLDIAMSLTSLKAVRPLWNNEVALGRKQTFCQRCIFQPPKYKEYK